MKHSSSVLKQREIISESNLHKELMRNLTDCLSFEPIPTVTMEPNDTNTFLDAWKNGIARHVSKLSRSAMSALDALPDGCLYQCLNEKLWKRAAQICELFRKPSITKNAGRLDTLTLQRKFHDALMDGSPFSLVIGWGQPKRTAGGLKTPGPFADLAEMYAIRRLLVICRAVTQICQIPVSITVLTGGSRFVEALFTREEIAFQYDQQRQKIADFLGNKDEIRFVPYSDLIGAHKEMDAKQQTKQRLETYLTEVTDEMVQPKFSTILLNVDWDHLITLEREKRFLAPHGIVLPSSVATWLEHQDELSRCRLICAAIVGIICPRRQSEWLNVFGEERVFEDTLTFVHNVAWESARKYIALHLMDAHDEASRILVKDGANVVRLTVHEKNDRRDIPAIFLLGADGGNLLPQHVLAVIQANGQIVFESKIELRQRDVKAICLSSDENSCALYPLFEWLIPAQQPLCYVEAGDAAFAERLNKTASEL